MSLLLAASTGSGLIADKGSYAISGNSANLYYTRALVGNNGAYVISGNSSKLTYHEWLDSGFYNISGNNALLTYSPNTPFINTEDTYQKKRAAGMRRQFKMKLDKEDSELMEIINTFMVWVD